ncbi:MAG: ATP-binding protein [Acidobacteriaceae bacterium]|nr:ATP-binding protein [Acidobacteriaceae bacterium]
MNLTQLHRTFLQVLLLPVVVLLVVAAVSVWQISSGVRTVERITQLDRNISYSVAISNQISDEDAGLRGFQITGNEIFLQPYQMAPRPLQSLFKNLRQNLIQLGESTSDIDQIEAANNRFRAQLGQSIIDAVNAGQYTSDPGLNLREKARTDALHDALHTFAYRQRDLRDAAVEHFHHTVKHLIEVAIWLAIVIGLMIGIFARGRLHAISIAFQTTLEALRKNTEEIHASEQRLRTILTSIGDAVFVCDTQGRIEMLNTVALALIQRPQDEALHQSLETLLPLLEEKSHEPLAPVLTSITQQESGSSITRQGTLVDPGGQELVLDASASIILDAFDHPTGTVIVLRDVTEQRQTLTTLLATEKLAVAGRLAATIAHEIHNPIDAVMNLLYLLRNDPTPEERTEFLKLAASELDRVVQISRAMLGMYRESKTPVKVDIAELLESLSLLLEPHFSQGEVTLEKHLLPGVIVMGYPAELRQVFTNLLTNALDACAPGATVSITMQRDIQPHQLRINVTDTGTGIPAETQAHLFTAFYTTKGEQGTGLGLWVSRGIVEKHGGRILLKSDTSPAHHGTTLSVLLPRASAALMTVGGSADAPPLHTQSL